MDGWKVAWKTPGKKKMMNLIAAPVSWVAREERGGGGGEEAALPDFFTQPKGTRSNF